MVTLRLFHAADPFRPIESRTVEAGEVELGRDPGLDWPIADAACELSRRHCLLRVSDEGVHVRDVSANGVFVGRDKRRLPRDVDTLVARDDVIHLGQFMLTVDFAQAPANDRADSPLDAPFHAPMLQEPPVSAADFAVHEAWPAQPSQPHAAPVSDAALLEAFCEGAGLDPSHFVGEDTADLARRAGAIYRQTVLGLAELMNERSSLKVEFGMNRTTVGATNNNPFKWAEPHRVAVDLLRTANGPFLSGAGAVNASFQDIKRHLLCLMAGSRAAVMAALDEVSPARISEQAKGRHLIFKAQACWREFQRRHEHAVAEARENPESAVNCAFKQAYERHVRALDELTAS